MADISHSHFHTGRLENLAWRILHAFDREPRKSLPAELRKLPDHLLRDIGVERSDLPPALDDVTTRAGMLESRAAVAAWRASTVR
ncbi:DUF1127 domain-containing protein [Rhizobium sp. LjRoot254]|uniref:DUF1127 domain-containing protein n=1 Tax=Rhizobium sp. LjRoot254 TaxID=3342297 RepID=UPI003ECFA985